MLEKRLQRGTVLSTAGQKFTQISVPSRGLLPCLSMAHTCDWL